MKICLSFLVWLIFLSSYLTGQTVTLSGSCKTDDDLQLFYLSQAKHWLNANGMNDSDDSIACASAYAYMRIHGDKSSVNFFIGFLQGRLRFPPPSEWRNVLSGTRVAATSRPSEGDAYIDGEILKLVNSNSEISLSMLDGRNLVFPSHLFPASKKGHYWSIGLSDERVFIGSIFERAGPFVIQCIDLKSMSPRWEAKILSDANEMSFGGRDFHVVQLFVVEGNLLVFGFSSAGFYMERFNCETGESSMRLNSRILDHGLRGEGKGVRGEGKGVWSLNRD